MSSLNVYLGIKHQRGLDIRIDVAMKSHC
jgi:hypothetical protein